MRLVDVSAILIPSPLRLPLIVLSPKSSVTPVVTINPSSRHTVVTTGSLSLSKTVSITTLLPHEQGTAPPQSIGGTAKAGNTKKAPIINIEIATTANPCIDE